MISWARGCLSLLHITQSSSTVQLCFWSVSSFKQFWRAALNSVLSLSLPHTTPLQRGALRGAGQCYWQQPRQRSIMWKAHGDTDLPSFTVNDPPWALQLFPAALGVFVFPGGQICSQRRDRALHTTPLSLKRCSDMWTLLWKLALQVWLSFQSKNVSIEIVSHKAFKFWLFFKLHSYPSQEMLGQDN